MPTCYENWWLVYSQLLCYVRSHVWTHTNTHATMHTQPPAYTCTNAFMRVYIFYYKYHYIIISKYIKLYYLHYNMCTFFVCVTIRRIEIIIIYEHYVFHHFVIIGVQFKHCNMPFYLLIFRNSRMLHCQCGISIRSVLMVFFIMHIFDYRDILYIYVYCDALLLPLVVYTPLLR